MANYGEIIDCKNCRYRPVRNEEKSGPNYFAPDEEAEEKCPLICGDPFYTVDKGPFFYCANGKYKGVKDE